MDSWVNGAYGSDVKRVIDSNFDILDKRTAKISDDISKLEPLSINFISSEWVFVNNTKTYAISIPFSNYNKANPCVDVYIKSEDGYSLVYGGHKICESSIVLQSDIPYEGRVVIR